ncbi:MAG: type III pantothenate kinase [Methylococcaceae bacterium]|nr:type III pantothenate kinase [Methylococcaceae bacterium]MCI0733051.1 type III pantothenate kinase [Methylococcaceae bacterium]
MSSLLIDIGNSRLKWAFKKQDRLEPGRPVQSIDGIFDFDGIWNKLEPPARILVSNVLGEETDRILQRWIDSQWPVFVEFIHSCSKGYGVENGYQNPDQLGVDRWISMVAARAMFKEPVCIADCGTAITVDVVDGQGRHQGGVICPGVKLMQDALIRGTRKLSFDGLVPGALLGLDTGTGIYSGTLTAAAGLIEKLLEEAEQSLKTKLKLLITGGDAELVMERLRVSYLAMPNLVLQGLAVIESAGGSAAAKA